MINETIKAIVEIDEIKVELEATVTGSSDHWVDDEPDDLELMWDGKASNFILMVSGVMDETEFIGWKAALEAQVLEEARAAHSASRNAWIEDQYEARLGD